MIWRERRILLGSIAALLLANLIFFFTYRVQYQERVNDLRVKMEQAELQLQNAQQRRIELEQQLSSYDDTVKAINLVYDEWWATPEERLTRVIQKVRQLGRESGLVPSSISFARHAEKGESNAVTMSIGFNVRGTYEQVRTLINLIELSEEFMIIDSIGINQSEGEMLSLNIQLKTLFKETRPAETDRSS